MSFSLGELSSSSWLQARRWVEERKIQGVIFDFDRTLISFHTGGCMDPVALAVALRREPQTDFVAANQWLDHHFPRMRRGIASFADIRHAPVEFSGVYLAGKVMIQTTLKHLLGDQAKLYQVVANDPKLTTGRDMNKNWHLELFASTWQLPPSAILLIDDDKRNIAAAKKQGYHTWHVEGKRGFQLSEIFPSTSPIVQVSPPPSTSPATVTVSPPPTIVKGPSNMEVIIPSLPLASLGVSGSIHDSKLPRHLAPVPLHHHYEPARMPQVSQWTIPPIPATPLLKPTIPRHTRSKKNTTLNPLSIPPPATRVVASSDSMNKD